MKIIRNFQIIMGLFSMFLYGCSFPALTHQVADNINKSESAIESADVKVNRINIPQDFVQHTSSGYFGNQVVVQHDTDFLPPLFSQQIQFDRQFSGLKSVAAGLTDFTKIPIMLDINMADNNDSCIDARITQQEGSLIDLFNLIGARCDIAWSYHDGKVILSDTETRVWPVKGIPGDVQVQNQINNNTGAQSQSGATGTTVGSSSGGGGGATAQSQVNSVQSTTQNISFNLQNSLWQNLQDGIKSMLSKNGKLSISPSTSSLTVTDRPSVLLRVDRYMKNQNNILKRMVAIDIQVLSVDVNSEDNYGINWNLALKGTNASFTINGQAVVTSQGGSGFVPSPVFVPTNTTQAFTIGANSGDLNGSQLVINALSTIAKTSLVTSTAVTTLSNQPVPVQFVDQLSYLASVTTTQTAQVGSQTALTPGELTTGFSLNILPVIENDKKVNLQISLNLSALKNIAQYSTQGASVQLPETLQRNFMQKVVIQSGDTFVVTGFDSDANAITNTGVGSAYNWILGGGVSASKVRTRLVVLVTPRVIIS